MSGEHPEGLPEAHSQNLHGRRRQANPAEVKSGRASNPLAQLTPQPDKVSNCVSIRIGHRLERLRGFETAFDRRFERLDQPGTEKRTP